MKKQTTNKKSSPLKRVTGSKGNGKANAASRSTKSTNGKEDMDSALHDFFIDGLKDIYWAEKHLVKTLPKMAKATSTDELKQAFENHLKQTRGHVERLEEVFQLLDEKAVAKKCDAMEGITKEGDHAIEDTDEGSITRDAALIVSAQKVEHYEIASYGSLAQLARTMNHTQAAEILGQILDEEKDADEILTGLAESGINASAMQE